MLKQLGLINFMQHESLEVNFTEGLNVIRGENEKGKTTLFYATQYAFYGSRALPESLDETVTWGKPVSTLRVLLTFDHDGVEYSISRGKSGASLRSSTDIKVDGQSEVTNFVSKLFKADRDIAQSVMYVGQDTIKETLKGAGGLIETLSETSLVDSLVTAVQTHLPSGSTKVQELELVNLTEVLANKPVADYAHLTQAHKDALDAHVDATIRYRELLEGYDQLSAKRDQAIKDLATDAANKANRKKLEAELQNLETLIAGFLPVSNYDLADLKAKADFQADNRKKLKAKRAVEAVPVAKRQSRVDWQNLVDSLSETIRLDIDEEVQVQQGIAVTKAMLITGDTCRMCQKDLKDVPEVVASNLKLSDDLQALQADLLDVKLRVATNKQKLQELKAVEVSDRHVESSGLPYTEYYEVDLTVIPRKWNWKESVRPSSPDGSEDHSERYLKAKAHNEANAQKIKQVELRESQRDALIQRLKEPLPTYNLVALNADIEAAKQLAASIEVSFNTLNHLLTLKHEAAKAESEAIAKYQYQVLNYQRAEADKDRLLSQVQVMNLHNGIIKKLREARPIVVQKLWALVLHTVTDYFTQIRGTPSVVTRGESGFLIDGKSLGLFSGSTKDSLGLAIRIALQKVFLPNVDFALLDEPAAAMADSREQRLIGVIASCGFRQTILVTHSDAADTLATNLIEL